MLMYFDHWPKEFKIEQSTARDFTIFCSFYKKNIYHFIILESLAAANSYKISLQSFSKLLEKQSMYIGTEQC